MSLQDGTLIPDPQDQHLPLGLGTNSNYSTHCPDTGQIWIKFTKGQNYYIVQEGDNFCGFIPVKLKWSLGYIGQV